jgi:ribosome-associated protein
MKTIVENIEKKLLEKKQKPISIEGLSSTRWILMDYGDVIIHVFDEETRSYYELEKLWMDAPKIKLDIEEKILR